MVLVRFEHLKVCHKGLLCAYLNGIASRQRRNPMLDLSQEKICREARGPLPEEAGACILRMHAET